MEENLTIEDFADGAITAERSAEFFNRISEIEGMANYFRDSAVQDMKFYFAASTDKERDTIRGHYNFAMFMYNGVRKAQKNRATKK